LITEICTQRNQEVHACLIDLRKAFDSIDRKQLFDNLIELNYPQDVVNILGSAYQRETSRLILNGKPSTAWPVNIGVRQGAPSSPTLFNLIPNQLAKALSQLKEGIDIDGTNINVLMYADDIVLLANSQEQL
jgi:hypothetical protein